MNVVNNICTDTEPIIRICWKCHCEFSLICSSIFNTENWKSTAILIEDASFHQSKNWAQLHCSCMARAVRGNKVYGNWRNPFLDLMNIIVRSAISLNRQIGIVITRLNPEDFFLIAQAKWIFKKCLSKTLTQRKVECHWITTSLWQRHQKCLGWFTGFEIFSRECPWSAL